MFLRKFKKQKHKEKKKDNFFRYFRPAFVILVIMAAGFFVYEKSAHEPSVSFLIEPEKVEQQVIKEIVETEEEITKEPKKNIP